MPRLAFRAATLAAAIFLSIISIAAQAQPAARDFLWEMRNVQLSPDGQYISMIQPYEGRTALVVYPASGGGEPTLIEGGQRGTTENVEVSSHFWSGDKMVVTVNWNDHYRGRFSNFRLEQTRLLAVSPDGRDIQVLFESRQDQESDVSQESWIVDTLEDEDNYILVSLFEWVDNVGFRTVQRVNLSTGRSVRVAQGTDDTVAWATDSDGNVIARTDLADGNLKLYARAPGNISWNLVRSAPWFSSTGQGDLSPIAALDGGRMLYVTSNHEGRIGIYKMDLDSPGNLERVFLHDWVDVDGLIFSVEEDKAIGVNYTVHSPTTYYLDEEAAEDSQRYARMLLGGDTAMSVNDRDIGPRVAVSSETDDENVRILATYGPGDPMVYYLMNDETRSISELGQRNPNLSPSNLASIQVVTYRARDGLEIPGYLALPPGRTLGDGPLPFVLYPHGGPNARDDAMFDTLRQFLATRGYAVFAPQFRGTRGFGNEFMRQGFEEWGGAMQNDLTDATQAMIDMGVADPDHMCIVGWSYSAYAAIHAAVDTPDLYNCAVGINGVYDLPLMMSNTRTDRAWGSLEFWSHSMGDDWDHLGRMSPNRRVDEITIPILVIASVEDPVVPYEETTRIVGSLERANIPHQSHIFEYGNHSMDYRPNMEETFQLLESFLDANM